MEAQDQVADGKERSLSERRRQPRFKFEVGISVSSRSCGVLKGRTVDISESGISAILRIEVPTNEVVELDFITPFGRVKAYAMVRQRNAFRYGFQFVDSGAVEERIRVTCRQLAMEQEVVSG